MKKSIQFMSTGMLLFFLLSVMIACTQTQNENLNKDEKALQKQNTSALPDEMIPEEKGKLNFRERAGAKANVSYAMRNNSFSEEALEEEDKEGDRDLMEDALAYLNASQKHWEQGDIEKALDLLDQAYTLVLETDGDLEIARQKDDLRLLISKRIMAIYSSIQQPTTRGNRSEIPLAMNADVQREIRSFQTGERDFFIASYQRSGLYREAIVAELKKAGLPEELSWLPLVESGFKSGALSKARALGLWQFIPSTGYKYSLNRDEWVDERMDAAKSTKAAISYLKELHGMFGDWLTVLAAYNSGEGRVMRVISRQHINYLDRFWDLYHRLPNETARYVPRFLATLHIIRDPGKYGFDFTREAARKTPYEYKIVKSYKPMKLQDIAFYTGAEEEKVNCLNTELRHKMTPDKEYELKLPVEVAEKYAQVVDQIPESEKPGNTAVTSRISAIKEEKKIERPVERRATKSNFLTHRVKRGESINSIASRYGISPRTLRAHNSLSSRRSLAAGQRLVIPLENAGRSGKGSAQVAGSEKNFSGKNSQVKEALVRYKVKKGDSLASLARRFGTTEAEIKKMNRLNGRSLASGRVIKISRSGEEDEADSEPKKEIKKKKRRAGLQLGEKTYLVKKGDNLFQIAQRNNISLDRLREINNIAKSDDLRAGQTLIVQ